MEILQLVNKVPFPAIDGGAIAVSNLTKGFSGHGHSVTMLAMNTTKHYCKPEDIPAEVHQFVDLQVVDVEAPITPIGGLKNMLFSKLPYSADRFISKDYEDALIQILQEKAIDVVQLEGLYMALYIPVIRKHSRALIAFRAHNIEEEIWLRVAMQEKNIFKRLYLKNLSKRIHRLQKTMLDQYDVLVPITERDENIFQKMGNTKPSFVSQTGLFVDDLKRESTEPETIDLFTIGALDWAPNQEGLVWFFDKIWGEVLKDFPDLKFYVAGRNAPEWMEKKLRKTQNVVYQGEVDDAYDFMNAHSLMIVPLLSGSGMRIKIIEGMALGKCIVTTLVGSEGIATQHKQNIMIGDNEIEFLSSIKKVLKDAELRKEIGQNAAGFIAENYDNKAISKKLLNFYQSQINFKEKGNE
ncbi:MAG: glycosyltransferase family 4 protein [Bacteroidales bacterium]|nr:glycosyltransferase family 4 protein [Bacteroidales bacterium]MCF8456056.1 glycosyltransferase family 4 protein [Bacteroidales bacterium]